ncbi:MAG: extracellular solute-binding protein [Gemmataceae bacterium]
MLSGCSRGDQRVVVACAQDREFAEGVFAEFEKAHKLSIAAKYDTEANKSVGLAAELVAEVSRPRVDVHWNNEILATIRLARKGVYAKYTSPNAKPFPDWTHAPDGTWQAFAARARVLIVNTKIVPEADRPHSIFDLTNPKWKGKVAIAKPLFGTTATQAACLFEVLGRDDAKAFYRGILANEVGLVAGNKQVAVDVASGRFAMGLTDTDDAITELNDGKSVAIIYPDRDGHPKHSRLGVLFIPNTLAVIEKGPNPKGAHLLIDELLKVETETTLAEGGGYQIPLNPKVHAKLHPALVKPTDVKVMDVNFEKAADLWDEVQEFLRNEIVK